MNTTKHMLVRIAAFTGFALGGFAVAALASSTWTAPPCNTPSQCNVDMPINAGGTAQYKSGYLAVGKSANPTSGYALDVNGIGTFTGLAIFGTASTTNLITANLKVTGVGSGKYLKVGSGGSVSGSNPTINVTSGSESIASGSGCAPGSFVSEIIFVGATVSGYRCAPAVVSIQ